MTVMFLEDRQGIDQSASLVIFSLLSLKGSQVFGSQEKMYAASMRGKFISKFTIQTNLISMV